MPEPALSEIAFDNLAEHPAVLAWSHLQPRRLEPNAIQTLKKNRKSAIYRLHGAGPDGLPVIAKRSLTETALTEGKIYREILPELPMPALYCYGMVQDATPGFHWLFLEDAGSETYSPALPEHRAAAARWLAHLHINALRAGAAPLLPGRGSEFYLEQLQLARANIISSFANPSLKRGERAVLDQLVAQCDLLESRWGQVETFCQGIPETFVHGDLKPKNFRVRLAGDELSLLAFDWEIAGWGVPATDLIRCPDLELYWSEVRQCWPELKFSRLQQLATVGSLFRALISVFWKSLALSYEWVDWPVEKLKLYHARLIETTRALGLG